MISTVLFDLDGTLCDSASSILACLRKAFDDLECPWVDESRARALLGPPFWDTLPPLVGAERTERAIQLYRHYYVDEGGMYDAPAFPGVLDVVAELSRRGVTLAVATSKPEIHAGEIVRALGIAECFATVGGDTLDGSRASKALVVGEVLHRLGRPDPATVLMVGDRSHDVLGSAAHGLECAGVLWGYGSAAELTTAGARVLCDRPADLLALIG